MVDVQKSDEMTCWFVDDRPFLFINPDGVIESSRIPSVIDSSHLHGMMTRTIGDNRMSFDDFQRSMDGILALESTPHALLRRMHTIDGASVRDVALFGDHLYRRDVAVAQTLADLVITDEGHAMFSDENIIVFGDGADDDRVDACLVARHLYDAVRLVLPNEESAYFPIGGRALAVLIESLRHARQFETMNRIAVAGPPFIDAIPERLRARIEIRVHGAVDISTIEPDMDTYRRMPSRMRPVGVALSATIHVVLQATNKDVVSAPIAVDMIVPMFDQSNNEQFVRLPMYERFEQALSTYPRPGGEILFILANTKDRVARIARHSIPEIVFDLANVFRQEVQRMAEPTSRYSQSVAERRLVEESVYAFFPLALLCIDHWTIDDDMSLSDVEDILRRIAIDGISAKLVGHRTWQIQGVRYDNETLDMTIHVVDN